jgi:hypothetical protein
MHHVRGTATKLAVAALTLLSGCYATSSTYPPEFAFAVRTDNMCTAITGTYINAGEAALAERLPNVSPYLAELLLPSGPGLVQATRVELAIGLDHVLVVRAYRDATVVAEAGYAPSPDGLQCSALSAEIRPRAVTLQKGEDGTLIVHVTQRPLPEILIPGQFAPANWARFRPTS